MGGEGGIKLSEVWNVNASWDGPAEGEILVRVSGEDGVVTIMFEHTGESVVCGENGGENGGEFIEGNYQLCFNYNNWTRVLQRDQGDG